MLTSAVTLADAADRAGTLLDRAASADFWLGAPLKILVVVIVAAVANLLATLLIRKATDGVASGTRARIVARRTAKGEAWVEDSSLPTERQAQRAQTVGSVLRSVTSVVIWAVALLTVVSEAGIDIAPVLASAGIAGVALSFGAQSLVKDYLAGIFIVAEDQLGIGDVVDLGEASGTVESVGLRTTQVRDVQGTLWHVRNGEILRVGNSSQGWARTVMDVQVPYSADIDEASQLILETAQRTKRSTQAGRSIMGSPEVWGVEQLTGESITLRLAVKTAPLQQWAVARELRAQLKAALDAHGYRIPLVNQSVVHQGHAEPGVRAEQVGAEQVTGQVGTEQVSTEQQPPSAGSAAHGS